MKALVVDDSTTMRRILASTLREAGCTEVVEAVDGADGVAKGINQAIELVLMDWNMPNMNGLDALKEIRKSGETMPVIMVTTEAEKSRVIEALKAGASSYILKPFKSEEMVEKLRSFVTAG